MFHFNRLITEKNPNADEAIIRTFYAGVLAWRQENPSENKIDHIEKVHTLWNYYALQFTQNLPLSQRVRELTSLVIYQPQILPQEFTYLDVLKSAFLIAIPDLLLHQYLGIQLRRSRDDELFGSITYVLQDDSHYCLMAGTTESIDAFEELVITHEIALGARSKFNKFKSYLDAQEEFNQYTVAWFSLMFLDDIVGNINAILLDKQLTPAFMSAAINPVQWIDFLHSMCGWYLTAYFRKKQDSMVTQHEIAEEEKSFSSANFEYQLAAGLREVQIINHVAVARQIRHDFVLDATGKPLLDQYQDHIKFNISLGISPAITAKEKARQALIYPQAVSARLVTTSLDVLDQKNAALALGLTATESPRKFICDDYDLPNTAFIFSDLATYTHTDILISIFVGAIFFVKQVNEAQCGQEFYRISITRLWNAFLQDPRCPQAIKNRLFRIDINTPLPVELDVINKICAHGVVDASVMIEFSLLLNRTARTGKSNLLLALANIVCADSPEQSLAINDAAIMIYLQHRLSEKAFSRASGVKAMSLLLNSTLPFLHRLILMGAIADGKIAHPQAKRSEATTHFYFQMRVLFEIKETMTLEQIIPLISQALSPEIFDAITVIVNETRIPVLISWYENAEAPHKYVPVLLWHINSQCSREQLICLKNILNQYVLPTTSSRFFPNFLSPTRLQSIINEIEREQSSADILLKLKQIVRSLSQTSSAEILEFYNVVNQFFSSEESDTTMEMLLRQIDPAQKVAASSAANASL